MKAFLNYTETSKKAVKMPHLSIRIPKCNLKMLPFLQVNI